MKKFLGSLAVAAGLVVLGASGAQAAPGTFDPDTGIVTVVNDGIGSSYEFTSVLPVHNGDTITFEYRTDDVACAGGVPRVFIQGGAYNTFDADPAGPGACGTDTDGDGWYTVTGTISGITDGAAGLVGFVNDNPADPGTIEFRNLEINGNDLLPASPKDACRNGGWEDGGYRNQGQCIKALNRAGR
jgi:hypothetical protein